MGKIRTRRYNLLTSKGSFAVCVFVPCDCIVISRSTCKVHVPVSVNIGGKYTIGIIRTRRHDLLRSKGSFAVCVFVPCDCIVINRSTCKVHVSISVDIGDKYTYGTIRTRRYDLLSPKAFKSAHFCFKGMIDRTAAFSVDTGAWSNDFDLRLVAYSVCLALLRAVV